MTKRRMRDNWVVYLPGPHPQEASEAAVRRNVSGAERYLKITA